MDDIARHFPIRESSHRVLNPIDEPKLATLGAALHLQPGTTVLDLACGKGELLCTWSRDFGVSGIGVDLSTAFVAAARERVSELGLGERVRVVHADASTYVAPELADLVGCVGATWIGGGLVGTLALMERSLRPGGTLVVGEPYWLETPPTQEAIEGSHALALDDFSSLPELVAVLGEQGWDLVEMVLADGDSWDRYEAAHWHNLRTFLDEHPEDELADELRAELRAAPLRYVTYTRRYLGWGAFALRRR